MNQNPSSQHFPKSHSLKIFQWNCYSVTSNLFDILLWNYIHTLLTPFYSAPISQANNTSTLFLLFKPWIYKMDLSRKKIVFFCGICINHYNLNASLYKCNLIQSPCCNYDSHLKTLIMFFSIVLSSIFTEIFRSYSYPTILKNSPPETSQPFLLIPPPLSSHKSLNSLRNIVSKFKALNFNSPSYSPLPLFPSPPFPLIPSHLHTPFCKCFHRHMNIETESFVRGI